MTGLGDTGNKAPGFEFRGAHHALHAMNQKSCRVGAGSPLTSKVPES